MDIQQLLTFISISSERSFVRASQKLGISQPTVTARIRSLEEELGEHLIIRTGQEAILTPSGEIFLSYSERAVQVFQSGIDRLNNMLSRGLKIAGTPTFNSYVLPRHLMHFNQEQPNVRIQVLTGSSLEIKQMLQDHVVDIGFVQGVEKGYNVIEYPVFSEELQLTVHRDHPLSSRDVVRLSDLTNETIIAYRRNTHSWELVESRFRQEAFKPVQVMEMDHVSGMRQMVLSGMGVAFLPKQVMKEDLRKKQVKMLELDGSPITRHTYIAVPNRTLASSTASFLRYIHKTYHLKQMPAEIERLLAE